MAIWQTVFKGVIEGRPVEAQVWDEGGCRVRTTVAEDGEGFFSASPAGISHVPPPVAGDPIDIDGDTPEELIAGLEAERFSPDSIGEILAHFNRDHSSKA